MIFFNFNVLDNPFAFAKPLIFLRPHFDSFHGGPFQRIAQRFFPFSFDRHPSVLELDLHNVLAALTGEFRVLKIIPKKLLESCTVYRHNGALNPFIKDRFRYDALSHTDLSRASGMRRG